MVMRTIGSASILRGGPDLGTAGELGEEMDINLALERGDHARKLLAGTHFMP